MQIGEVEAIFEIKKSDLIGKYETSSNPIAILLGGQPASGKSNLALVAEKEHFNTIFFKINGDNYRIFHPQHDER
jgi:adenylylsulfate kinase-like enzyme